MLDLSSKENMIRIDNSFCQIFKVAFVGIIIHLSACAQMLNEQSRDLYPGKANNLNHFSSWNCTDPSQEAGTTAKLWAMGLCVPQGKYKGEKEDTTPRALWPNHQVYVKKGHLQPLVFHLDHHGPCVQWPVVAHRPQLSRLGVMEYVTGPLVPMVSHPGPLNLA